MKIENAIEGIFLRPSAEDARIIWDAVAAEGLEPNAGGVLELLMRYITGNKTRGNVLLDYFKENPEDLKTLKNLGKAGLQTILSKFIK